VLLLCKSKLNSNHIALKVDLHPEATMITGDKSQLQQVLLNLITNAADALTLDTSKQKRITLRTQLQGDRVLLTVTDNGSGIAPEIAASIFELLRTNKEDGMGIGLWLSRTIEETHQGTIDFVTDTNSGTTFTVNLPATTGPMIY
jgi:signal transduction histidine kinase